MSKHTLTYPERSVWGPKSILKRELIKHSVEKDVKKFCEWKLLIEIVEAAQSIGFKGTRNAGFVSALFNCGSRVSETLLLKPDMFGVYKGCQPKLILVEGIPLLKRYQKIDEYVDEHGKRRYHTKTIEVTRDVSMRVDEPLIKPMLNWVVHALKNNYEWLFPSPYKDGPLSRKWAYLLIQKIEKRVGLELYPHWFRAQRASQLASEYDFREAGLLEWFQWEKWETAKKYCKLGPLGLAKKMGVKFRKKRGLKPKELESLVV